MLPVFQKSYYIWNYLSPISPKEPINHIPWIAAYFNS